MGQEFGRSIEVDLLPSEDSRIVRLIPQVYGGSGSAYPSPAAWPRVALIAPDGVRWSIGGDGWNALLRAALTVLLPLQCVGQMRPFRVTQVKERVGVLVISRPVRRTSSLRTP